MKFCSLLIDPLFVTPSILSLNVLSFKPIMFWVKYIIALITRRADKKEMQPFQIVLAAGDFVACRQKFSANCKLFFCLLPLACKGILLFPPIVSVMIPASTKHLKRKVSQQFLYFCVCVAFRNWMNSIGVSPYVNNLYRDLCHGLVLLQVTYDFSLPRVPKIKIQDKSQISNVKKYI